MTQIHRTIRTDLIECPKCFCVQPAEVTLAAGDPWPSFVHTCECGYTITESEWQEYSPTAGDHLSANGVYVHVDSVDGDTVFYRRWVGEKFVGFERKLLLDCLADIAKTRPGVNRDGMANADLTDEEYARQKETGRCVDCGQLVAECRCGDAE